MDLQHRTPADLVITDLRMPGKDGSQIIQELRAGFPATRVIAMSAVHTEESRALDLDGRIEKPFSLKDVLEKVKDVLAG